MTVAALHEYLEQSARRYRETCAAVEASSGRQITYGELDSAVGAKSATICVGSASGRGTASAFAFQNRSLRSLFCSAS